VRPRRVDVEEEPFEERALARRDLGQPADEHAPRAQVGVRHRPGALQDEAADEVGVAERQLLGDDAAAGEAGDVGGGNVERAQDPGGVVGHLLHRDRTRGHRGPSRAAVVERGHPVPVGEPAELELPRLDGVAEAADEQDVRSKPDLLDVDLEAVRLDHLRAVG
jgi:hypothetical protein